MSPPAIIVAVAAAAALLLAVRAGAVAPAGGRVRGALRRLVLDARDATAARAERSGWPGGARALAITQAGAPLAAGILAGFLAGAVVGVLALAAGAAAVALAPGLLARRRLEAVASAVPDMCDRMAAAIRGGRSLRAALERAAAEAPEPARSELRALAGDLALGARVDVALADAAARLPVPELMAVTATIDVQRRTGGSLVRALDELATRLRARRRLVAEVRAATAQARATAWIVGALPVVAGVVLEVTRPGTVGRLAGSGAGPLLVGVAGALYGVAVVAVIRISRTAV